MLSKFYWNSRWILFLLSMLDVLIILFLNPAKTWADIPKSSSSTVSSTISAPISKKDQAAVSHHSGNKLISQALSPVGEESPTSKSADFTQEDEINSVSNLLSGKKSPTSTPTDSTEEEQVNSVSQLSDVKPGDWAFQALQSLVERYGVISGYPDQTFKGNRALTRYEFAAALNAAQDRLRELLASNTSDLVRKEDWETLQKLQSQFSPELAALRGRVDLLEAKTAILEQQKFSATSVLNGRAQIVVGELFSGNNVITKKPAPHVVTMQENFSLRLNSSFTGKDVLTITGGGGSIISLGQTRAGLLGTYDGRTADNANITRPPNDFTLTGLRYRFLPGPNTQVNIYAQNDGANEIGFSVPINPYFESSFASGANGISRFSRRALVFNYGDNGPGIAVLHKFSKQLQVGVAYSAPNGANPSTNNGLFSGRYLALGQILYNNRKNNFRISAAYVNTYSPPNTTGFSGTNFGPAAGSNLVNSTVAGTGTVGNLYGIQAFYKFNPKFAMNGWVSYASHRYLGRGDGQAMDWAVGASFPDLFSKGSLGGVFVGMAPKMISLSRNVNLGAGFGQADKDLSLHVETFYQYKLSDNIDITPGLIWITAPDSNSSNPGSVFGWVRALYRF
ncbi:iron uptake porin [Aetokthonos hydrillicola Thurmond2011]|uniref:Iron uptake porin n=1 Tax=Aetokthonos hydrillicola Thurmond2011 TaxID=2712845 RepID=A0AAP5MBJ6_9CYAN|nr:iron uptake porin [Aetokthonos hydrillicola]MDR9896959.1 iron uptake porin [Aetokthonos hydrillicola Thurmond2011]